MVILKADKSEFYKITYFTICPSKAIHTRACIVWIVRTAATAFVLTRIWRAWSGNFFNRNIFYKILKQVNLELSESARAD